MAAGAGGIEVRGLGRRFGARPAVTGLTFDVAPGEVFGLLGPNGAGKTTTVRMLAGLLRPSEGAAVVCGEPVGVAPAPDGGEGLRRKVGLLTETPGLYDRLSARENLRFFMQLHALDERAAWARARGYLERFGLAGREEEPVGGFSKGMRQKLALVRALLHAPPVLFLDEPTSGLDPEAARGVRDALAELAGEGAALVLCSHNLPEVERLCARVAVVRGRVLALGRVEELRRAGEALEVHVEGDAARFVPALARLPGGAPRALCEGGRMRVLLADDGAAPDVVAALVGAGARVRAVAPARRPLEEVYLELLARSEAEDGG